MKFLKYLLRFLLFAIMGLLIAAIVIPVVFKDDIVVGVKNAINDNVNAKVDFEDIDLTLISTFPNAGIAISKLAIEGVDEFQSTQLAAIKKIVLEVSVPSLFDKSKPLEVRKILVEEPSFNILIKKNGQANYDIVKAAERQDQDGDYVMKLQSYKISNGSVTYTDRQSNQQSVIKGLNHAGSGEFYNELFDLDTKTTINELTYSLDGSTFLSHATAVADARIGVDLGSNTYTLEDNNMRINAMDLKLDGSLQLLDKAMVVNLNFDAPSENAKGIMSILPGVYSKDFAKANVSGIASFIGSVKGKYVGDKELYPALSVEAKITNGSMSYPDLGKDISNLDLDMSISAKQGNYNDMIVNIPSFKMQIGENDIVGNVTTSSLTSDPSVQGMLKGNIDLSDLKAALPIEGVKQLDGQLDVDVSFAGKQSDIVSENYDALDLEGTAIGTRLVYKAVDQPEIKIGKIESTINPAQIVLASPSIQAGKTYATAKLEVTNPMSYLVGAGKMVTTLKVNSELIDLNEWSTDSPTTGTESLHIPSEIANVKIDLNAKQLLFDDYEVKDMVLQGEHGDNDIYISRLSGQVGSSDFKLSGGIANTIGYFNNDEVLTGDLTLTSQKMVMEDFMRTDEAAASKEVILIPQNIDVKIASNINQAQYDKVTLQQLKGDVIVKDGQAEVREGQSRGLGGLIKFAGLYRTPIGEKPNFSFKYDLSDLQFSETFSAVDFTQSLAPIMKFIQGQFNSTLVMEGKLDDNMFPDLTTLDASGYLETISGTLSKIDLADRLADKLGVQELRKLGLDHTKNWFEIIDGTVEVKPFTKEIAGIEMSMKGRHGLGKNMRYEIIMDIPRAMLKKNVVTGGIDKGLSLLERQATRLGVNIDQGDFIKIKVDLTGELESPNIKITPLGSGGKSTTDILKDELDDLKDSVKDSVNTVVEQTTQQVKDTVEATIKTARDSVKAVVNETVETATDSAKKVADKAVQVQLDKILKDSAAQEVKDKAEDIINDATGGTVEDVKEKIKDWNPFKKKKKK